MENTGSLMAGASQSCGTVQLTKKRRFYSPNWLTVQDADKWDMEDIRALCKRVAELGNGPCKEHATRDTEVVWRVAEIGTTVPEESARLCYEAMAAECPGHNGDNGGHKLSLAAQFPAATTLKETWGVGR